MNRKKEDQELMEMATLHTIIGDEEQEDEEGFVDEDEDEDREETDDEVEEINF